MTSVQAEPYLAVRSGLKCSACHVNPTGGGLRNSFGRQYAKNELAARSISRSDQVLTGQLANYLSVGSDVRGNLDYVSTPGSADEFAFDLQSAQLYLNVELIPGQLSLYLDERVAPGSAVNREAYALWWLNERRFYLKTGRFFLPYGLRLQDDTAFIREVSGINFDNFDDGVEAGLEIDAWSINLAVTNGTSGGDETNRSKQVSLRAAFVQPNWRAGVSFNTNEGANDERREMANVFAGLKTGPLVWLAEFDVLRDEAPGQTTLEQHVAFLEGNYEVSRGHNLKLSLEYHDPNDEVNDDERRRASLLWEYTPIEFIQVRTGYRRYESEANNPIDEREIVFVQLHTFF